MAFEDELPEAPHTEAPAGGPVLYDEVSSEVLGGVPKMGDPIPKGTYHFRLDSYSTGGTAQEPYYMLQWKCQEEPNTGRIAFDIVTWASEDDIRAANDSRHPRCNEARAILNNRLMRAKSLMDACSWSGGFKALLDAHPEIKITIDLQERKTKALNPDGSAKMENGKKVYLPTGEMGNRIVKYLSLTRPS